MDMPYFLCPSSVLRILLCKMATSSRGSQSVYQSIEKLESRGIHLLIVIWTWENEIYNVDTIWEHCVQFSRAMHAYRHKNITIQIQGNTIHFLQYYNNVLLYSQVDFILRLLLVYCGILYRKRTVSTHEMHRNIFVTRLKE